MQLHKFIIIESLKKNIFSYMHKFCVDLTIISNLPAPHFDLPISFVCSHQSVPQSSGEDEEPGSSVGPSSAL